MPPRPAGPVTASRSSRLGKAPAKPCREQSKNSCALCHELEWRDGRFRPMLSMRHADPVREGSALEQVRRWARRNWSRAAKDGPAGLIIDVSGMPDLFDGEEHLRTDLEARLGRVDRNVQVGLGHASSLVSGCKGVAAGSTRPCGGKDPRGHPHEEDGAGIPGAGPRATLLRPTRLPGRWRRAGSGYRAVPRYSA